MQDGTVCDKTGKKCDDRLRPVVELFPYFSLYGCMLYSITSNLSILEVSSLLVEFCNAGVKVFLYI